MTDELRHRTKTVRFQDKDSGEVMESNTMKLFRPGTFELLQAFNDRMRVLPPHVKTALQAKFDTFERGVKIAATVKPGEESFFMPQTAEDEDELVAQLKSQMAMVEDEITKLQYAHSPAHVVAFEQQLLAYRANSAVQRAFPNKPGALQEATIAALKSATTYCWSPTCVEAVSEKADLLPPDAMPADLPLGEVMAPAACGWWWFEKPIPTKSTTSGEPIVALLWRRELRHVDDDHLIQRGRVEAARRTGTPLDAVDTAISRLGHAIDRAASGGVYTRTWFNAFIMESVVLGGRETLVPSPTLAWVWIDGMPISELQPTMVARFGELDRQGRAGVDALSSVESAESAVWLSKFWMAGGLWLDSRVTASGKRRPSMLAKVTTALPRQQARRLARLHHLGTLPTVEVVYLRRSEPRESEGGPGRTRDHEYCWLVKEFPRRQWFPSLGRHQLIMVAEHIRGPKDRPLKHAKRIYAVNR